MIVVVHSPSKREAFFLALRYVSLVLSGVFVIRAVMAGDAELAAAWAFGFVAMLQVVDR